VDQAETIYKLNRSVRLEQRRRQSKTWKHTALDDGSWLQGWYHLFTMFTDSIHATLRALSFLAFTIANCRVCQLFIRNVRPSVRLSVTLCTVLKCLSYRQRFSLPVAPSVCCSHNKCYGEITHQLMWLHVSYSIVAMPQSQYVYLVTLNFDLLTSKLVFWLHVTWATILPMLRFLHFFFSIKHRMDGQRDARDSN